MEEQKRESKIITHETAGELDNLFDFKEQEQTNPISKCM